jgi:hypothetical protein
VWRDANMSGGNKWITSRPSTRSMQVIFSEKSFSPTGRPHCTSSCPWPDSITKVNPSGDSYTYPDQPGGATVDLVKDGAATITLDPQGTIRLPNFPAEALHLASGPKFIYGHCGDG